MDKRNIHVILFIMPLILLSITIPTTLQSTAHDKLLCAIKGTLYINDEIAPEGIRIDLVFSDDTFNSTTFEWEDGFNYNIGIANHEGQTGLFYVFYLGQYFIPVNNQSIFIESGVVFYHMDLHIDTTNNPPDKPRDPDPANNSENINVNPTLSVLVTDPDNDVMTVYFYDNTTHTEIDHVVNVPNGTRINVTWENLDYNTSYEWYVVANESLLENTSDVWTFTTEKEDSNEPPTIELIKPESKRFYFRNRSLFRFPVILIIGYIDIKVNVSDSKGIEKVEFYIDGNLKNTRTESNEAEVYSWMWNERRVFRHTISVIAYDTDGNTATTTKSVFIFNFPLLHPLRP